MADRKRNISKFDPDSKEWKHTEPIEGSEELTEQIIPESGLIKELVEQSGTLDESLEEQSVDPDNKMIHSLLSTYLGDELLKELQENFNIAGIETIDNANNALVFGGRTKDGIKFLQYREDENLFPITPNDSMGGMQVISSLEKYSLSPADKFSDEKIKKVISNHIAKLKSRDKEDDDTRARQAKRLANIRRINRSLSTVFGFDDPRQAEAFIAAWLMKDSTCRLSGIPGTGKTTVVESAGLLLANSYGFDAENRFIPINPKDEESTFFQFLKGQEYDAYLNNDVEGVRVAWNNWRFTEWYNYDDKTGAKINRKLMEDKDNRDTTVSGSYLFDNTFLQQKYLVPQTTGGEMLKRKIGSMKPAEFRNALLNVWVWRETKKSSLDGSEYFAYHVLPINLGLEAFANGDGRITQGDKHPDLEELKKKPGFEKADYMALNTVNYGRILIPGITVPDGSTLADEVTRLNLRTDAGRNEGYDLREWLMTHYYDNRVSKKGGGAGWTEIKGEMLREIGTAKIDYDKRADEVLYGMDIRQVSRQDPIDKSKTISSYEFEPIPRPVVTQPVKFFNEANRSQSGVEDAILGLIAEKEVEYRGRSFRSPSFVAWMDTNPHQKGNDLAFVDRIDMELLFSTVTLGQRYIQLNAQYNPDSISTKSMDKEAISQPQDRIIFDSKIGIASDSPDKAQSLRINDLMELWKQVDNIKFNNTGGDLNNYDGLRDISFLSVMFTQRFMTKPTQNQAGNDRELMLPDSKRIHSSPLIDISKASNTALLQGDVPPGFANNAEAFGKLNEDKTKLQTPTLFKRVLGYRVTKSLVKLSRAFAFLRGKDFVTRTEILDALPYVVGHRMGPARAGDDPKGRDTGLIEGAMGSLTSEQELIKELIVAGYVKSNPLMGTKPKDGVWNPLAEEDSNPYDKNRKNTLLDVWDAYYQRCISILQSAGNFAEYEENVLHSLKESINGKKAVEQSNNTTPIHWHIAAMVVEQEKKADEGNCLRQDDGQTYQTRYNNYFKAMNAPTRNINPLVSEVSSTGEAIQLDYSLYDYYYLRGEISNDPLLFTDDRTYLLGLLESRIQAFVGATFNLNPEETVNVPYALSSSVMWKNESELVTNYIIQPNPGVAMNSTYNDAIGGFGQLFGKMDEDFNIKKLIPDEDYGDLAKIKASSKFSYQMSNQKMRITGSYQHKKDKSNNFIPINPKTARSPRGYLAASDAVTDKFSPYAGTGVVIKTGPSKTIMETNLDFGVTMEEIESALESILENPDMKPADAIKKVSPSPWMKEVFEEKGAIFCFEIQHHPNSRGANSLLMLMKEKGLIDMDATRIPGDDLRLWVWAAANIDDNTETATKTVSLVSTYGITSGFLENSVMDGNKLDFPGTFVAIDNQEFYSSGSSGAEDLPPFIDAGNITEADVKQYGSYFREAIRRSTQGA